MNNTVLIVDDDPVLRSMLAFSLEEGGYSIIEAASRNEAIEVLRMQSIHVVLLDMGMPPNEYTPEEGIAVLEWISSVLPQVRVVVLTGQDSESTSYDALKYGAFDFLEKPISTEALLRAIKRAFLFFEQAGKLKAQEGVQKVQIDAVLGEGVKAIRNKAEEKLIRQVLSDTEFNVHETARRLELKRENVYYLIKKYSLQRDSQA
ncbi:MAG: two-component system, response regulator RegA [Thiomicrorhabdus sp.]|nr:MAG: two-component system, response regulator RegA [Thiomicrorhabdus sp.]